MADDKETVFLSKELIEMMPNDNFFSTPKRAIINEVVIDTRKIQIKFVEISITDFIVELDFICTDEDFDFIILTVGKKIKIPSMMNLGSCIISSMKITNELHVKVVAIRE